VAVYRYYKTVDLLPPSSLQHNKNKFSTQTINSQQPKTNLKQSSIIQNGDHQVSISIRLPIQALLDIHLHFELIDVFTSILRNAYLHLELQEQQLTSQQERRKLRL
jgi:hypothetical protein